MSKRHRRDRKRSRASVEDHSSERAWRGGWADDLDLIIGLVLAIGAAVFLYFVNR